MPAVIPVTIPVGDTVATLAGLILHEPPEVASQNAVDDPVHTEKKYPDIAETDNVLTTIPFVAMLVPQALETE